jgi:hypothetical protein
MRALDVLVDRLDHDWYRGYYDASMSGALKNSDDMKMEGK